MSEENKMTEENKKTIIAFIAGLLVGGLLVFIFANPAADIDTATDVDTDNDSGDMSEEADGENMNEDETMPTNEEVETTVSEVELNNGEGAVEVEDQAAGSSVSLESIVFPTNGGWVGVREYENDQLTGLLGVARWNQTEGLLPTSIKLLRPTTSGNTYAIVFYTDNGDKTFSLATDVQMEGVMETFEVE